MGSLGNQPAGRKEAIVERRAKVLALRKAGHSYRDIARHLEVTADTVNRDLRAVLRELMKQQVADAAELRQMEAERLDVAMRAVAPKVAQGDLRAVDRWVRISESRRRLLGLDMQETIAGPTNNAYTLVIKQAEPPPSRRVDVIDAPIIQGERMQAHELPVLEGGDDERRD